MSLRRELHERRSDSACRRGLLGGAAAGDSGSTSVESDTIAHSCSTLIVILLIILIEGSDSARRDCFTVPAP